MRQALPFAMILALGACSDPGFRGVPEVQAVDQSAVAGCTLVANVSMKPGVYGPVLAEQGVKYARNKIMEDARAAGANRVVFDPVQPGVEVYELRATAWRC